MKKNANYFDYLSRVIAGELPIEAFIDSMGINRAEVNNEFKRLKPVNETKEPVPRPIYSFMHCEYPHIGDLLQACKLYSFAEGGSPYVHNETSIYDERIDQPYQQVGTFDHTKGYFVSGLRYLPIYKNNIPFEKSVMNLLFDPTPEFVQFFLPHMLEFGQTFSLTAGGRSLFSIMAYVIASNPDASYLCGKPTIPGSIKGLTLDTIASFAYDAYHPQRNPKLNPCRKNLLIPKKGVQVLGALPFSKMVAMHNRRMKKIGGPKILYKPKMSVEEKYLIAQQLLLLGSGTSFDHDKFRLPPMFNLYTRLVQDDGMVVIGDAVINDIYINEASEFPFLLQTNKISSMHTIFLQHYAQLLVK